ncbi:MAG: DUF378 domain-containing protein [Clostridia bacterium]
MLTLISFILVVLGAINWFLVGAFRFDIIAGIFGGASLVASILYIIIGIAALWLIFQVFRQEGRLNVLRDSAYGRGSDAILTGRTKKSAD